MVKKIIIILIVVLLLFAGGLLGVKKHMDNKYEKLKQGETFYSKKKTITLKEPKNQRLVVFENDQVAISIGLEDFKKDLEKSNKGLLKELEDVDNGQAQIVFTYDYGWAGVYLDRGEAMVFNKKTGQYVDKIQSEKKVSIFGLGINYYFIGNEKNFWYKTDMMN